MNQSVESQEWTTVIKPKNKLLEVNLKEIWQYRDLISLFIKRNIITQYKQTILGPTWYVVQPAMTVIMYMIVFGGIAGIPTDGVPPSLVLPRRYLYVAIFLRVPHEDLQHVCG